MAVLEDKLWLDEGVRDLVLLKFLYLCVTFSLNISTCYKGNIILYSLYVCCLQYYEINNINPLDNPRLTL